MAGLGEALKKSILGAKQDEAIKSGTLVVTRGIGVIAIALIGTFLLLDQLGDVGPWWKGLDTIAKLEFVVASAAVWAIVAGADVIARGLATARQNDFIATLPKGLTATKIEGKDSHGWDVVAAKFSGGAGADGPTYLVVKPGHEAEWLAAEKLQFG
jgi:hypothetical protein